mgnify:CR=1 FL=1
MKSASGRALADRLIASSSVVTENFAPGVMERWGLTYDRLRELREDVIFARMSGYGHSGPHHEYRSYGPVIQAVSGMSFISGLPDREPSGWGLSYMDNQAAYYNSAALLMAIFHRQRTGQGMEVDASAVEIGISLLGPDLLDTLVNQRPSRRPGFPRGNRSAHDDIAPHGVYPAAGDDQWVAITVTDDATGTTDVNLSTTVQPTLVTVNNSSKAYTFSGAGRIRAAATAPTGSTAGRWTTCTAPCSTGRNMVRSASWRRTSSPSARSRASASRCPRSRRGQGML